MAAVQRRPQSGVDRQTAPPAFSPALNWSRKANGDRSQRTDATKSCKEHRMVAAVQSPVSTSALTVDSIPLSDLRSRLEGELITADHADYDAARSTVSILNHSRPLAIVRAADERDIAAAVTFAREHGLPLSVRSG